MKSPLLLISEECIGHPDLGHNTRVNQRFEKRLSYFIAFRHCQIFYLSIHIIEHQPVVEPLLAEGDLDAKNIIFAGHHHLSESQDKVVKLSSNDLGPCSIFINKNLNSILTSSIFSKLLTQRLQVTTVGLASELLPGPWWKSGLSNFYSDLLRFSQENISENISKNMF